MARVVYRRGVSRFILFPPQEMRLLGRTRIRRVNNLEIVRRYSVWAIMGLIWIRMGTDGGLCACSNEPPTSIGCTNFLA